MAVESRRDAGAFRNSGDGRQAIDQAVRDPERPCALGNAR